MKKIKTFEKFNRINETRSYYDYEKLGELVMSKKRVLAILPPNSESNAPSIDKVKLTKMTQRFDAVVNIYDSNLDSNLTNQTVETSILNHMTIVKLDIGNVGDGNLYGKSMIEYSEWIQNLPNYVDLEKVYDL